MIVEIALGIVLGYILLALIPIALVLTVMLGAGVAVVWMGASMARVTSLVIARAARGAEPLLHLLGLASFGLILLVVYGVRLLRPYTNLLG